MNRLQFETIRNKLSKKFIHGNYLKGKNKEYFSDGVLECDKALVDYFYSTPNPKLDMEVKEYNYLQALFSQYLISNVKYSRQEYYNKGILSCKSILSSFYHKEDAQRLVPKQ